MLTRGSLSPPNDLSRLNQRKDLMSCSYSLTLTPTQSNRVCFFLQIRKIKRTFSGPAWEMRVGSQYRNQNVIQKNFEIFFLRLNIPALLSCIFTATMLFQHVTLSKSSEFLGKSFLPNILNLKRKMNSEKQPWKSLQMPSLLLTKTHSILFQRIRLNAT